MSVVLEASAGTGKTHAIVGVAIAALGGEVEVLADLAGGVLATPEFRALVAGGAVQPAELVVTTFTEAATRELRGRLRSRLAVVRRELAAAVADVDANPPADELAARWARLPAARREAVLLRLSAAASDFDRVQVTTMHGFCRRILRDHPGISRAGEAGEPLDEKTVALQFAQGWWTRRVAPDRARLQALRTAAIKQKALVSAATAALGSRGVPRALVPAGAMELVAELIDEVRAEWARAAAERGLESFQDQIVDVREALRRHPWLVASLRSRWRVALVDEAQDTDPVQLEIFQRVFDPGGSESSESSGSSGSSESSGSAAARRRLHAPGEPTRMLVLVGDPKQSIYGFRGADLDSYLAARAAASAPNLCRLGTNWRSEPALVDAVNVLWSRQRPFGREGIEHPAVRASGRPGLGTYRPAVPEDAAPIQVVAEASADGKGEWTLAEILARVGRARIGADSGERPLQWGDVAVLVRSNADLEEIAEHLRSAGVPVTALASGSVFEGAAGAVLADLLAAMAQPSRGSVLRTALANPPLSRLMSADPDEREAAAAEWSERFSGWAALLRRRGVPAAVESLLAWRASPEQPSLLTSLLAAPGGSRMAVDLLHIAELLHHGGGHDDPGSALLRLERQRRTDEDAPPRPGDPRQRRLETDRDAVRLQTIHSSKGLEYGVVLLPSLAVVPREPEVGSAVLLGASAVPTLAPGFAVPPGAAVSAVLTPVPGKEPLLRERALEEELRLFYVAVTRARHRVVMRITPGVSKTGPLVLGWLASGSEQSTDWNGVRAWLEAANTTRDGLIARRDPWPEGARAADGAARAEARAESGRADGVRTPSARRLRLWRESSFTSLVAAAEEDAGTDAAQDEETQAFVPTARTAGESPPAARAGAAPEADAAAPASAEPPPMSAETLPAGARTGRVVHRVMEWAVGRPDGAELRVLAEAAIAEAGAEGRLDAGAVAALVSEVLRAPLRVGSEGPSVTLARVLPSQVAAETDFCLPMGHRTSLSPARLGAALDRSPPGSPGAAYAPSAARLPWGEMEGFLRGQMDLILRDGDRWWILDYKTNDLGDAPHAYRAASLRSAMVADHYVLQYHLYAVALRRLLRGRGMEVEAIGAVYPFVRGVHAAAPGRGIFVDVVRPEVLDALDHLLAAPGGAAQGGGR
ncbi:MAG: UvrD-helicase domain-containing protein [Phycisphaerales bacterium]